MYFKYSLALPFFLYPSLSLLISLSVFIFTAAAAAGDNEDDDASLGWANFNYAGA